MRVPGEIQFHLLISGTVQLAVANDEARNMMTGFTTVNSN